MRIYRREAFLRLPEGVLFAKGKPWAFEDICRKGETIVHDGTAIDFIFRSFTWVDASDSGEAFSRLDQMLEAGASYPIDQDECRDGSFDNEDLFLVFEREDLLQLREAVDGALACCVMMERETAL